MSGSVSTWSKYAVRSNTNIFSLLDRGVTTSLTTDTRRTFRTPPPSVLSVEHEVVLKEASALTRSLYRSCIRSVRVIRHGNDHDEAEFVELERKQNERKFSRTDGAFAMLSMLPPVDRIDELRSRAEYYLQYARENFVQESDCLLHLSEGHLDRYVNLLRRGEDHRRWLLSDMKFEDPYKDSFDYARLQAFEKKVLQLYGSKEPSVSNEADADLAIDDEDDAWDDDDDDDDDTAPGLPPWYENLSSP